MLGKSGLNESPLARSGKNATLAPSVIADSSVHGNGFFEVHAINGARGTNAKAKSPIHTSLRAGGNDGRPDSAK
jgi:hypothetical protein